MHAPARPRVPRAAAAAALTAATLLALQGCALLGPEDAERDADGVIVEEQDADVFSIRIGDCLAPTGEESELESVPVVPCSQEHESEVYAEVIVPDGEFPGNAAIEEAADAGCMEHFEDFVGIPYADSELMYSYFSPTEQSWEELDDRQVLCLVYGPEASSTGSFGGSET